MDRVSMILRRLVAERWLDSKGRPARLAAGQIQRVALAASFPTLLLHPENLTACSHAVGSTLHAYIAKTPHSTLGEHATEL